ncbi:thioredoxin family protein [Magnetospirillum sp. UT-4]|uniref:thioredoxin family protein n=1 Tax=Magnetospirillum sp. UT-4 TaxID=2681467 RepID=UPI00137D11F2|nr:thioredoxin family protein [Magnetospirillum sp. UT-4]CAA7616045.1 putative thioredoxin [Magnetospirillum sp. UT-4]
MKFTTAAVAALFLSLAVPAPAPAAEMLPAPQMADDGFYHPDWFLVSFLDLKEDLADARKAGKQLMLTIEQRGCGACKRVHEVNLRDPRVVDYIRSRFHVIQIDLYGSREITDFDGQVLSEKDYARKLGVRATPAMLFYKDDATGGGGDAVAWKAVGYLEPEPYVNAFAYVHQRGFTGQKEPDFLAWLKGPGEKVRLQ